MSETLQKNYSDHSLPPAYSPAVILLSFITLLSPSGPCPCLVSYLSCLCIFHTRNDSTQSAWCWMTGLFQALPRCVNSFNFHDKHRREILASVLFCRWGNRSTKVEVTTWICIQIWLERLRMSLRCHAVPPITPTACLAPDIPHVSPHACMLSPGCPFCLAGLPTPLSSKTQLQSPSPQQSSYSLTHKCLDPVETEYTEHKES